MHVKDANENARKLSCPCLGKQYLQFAIKLFSPWGRACISRDTHTIFIWAEAPNAVHARVNGVKPAHNKVAFFSLHLYMHKQDMRISNVAFVWPITNGNSPSPRLKPDTAGFAMSRNKINSQHKVGQPAPLLSKLLAIAKMKKTTGSRAAARLCRAGCGNSTAQFETVFQRQHLHCHPGIIRNRMGHCAI